MGRLKWLVKAAQRTSANNNTGKEIAMMTRRSSLLAIAAIVSGIWLADGFSSVPLASAQPTQTEIKKGAKKKGAQSREEWQSMTPEEQKEAKGQAKQKGAEKREEWQSMTPEEQKEAKGQAKKRAGKTREQWQSLPQ
jgi:hypothetical protein